MLDIQENWLFYTEVPLLLSPHVCVSGFVSCRSRLSCISSDVSERLLLFPVVSLKPPHRKHHLVGAHRAALPLHANTLMNKSCRHPYLHACRENK